MLKSLTPVKAALTGGAIGFVVGVLSGGIGLGALVLGGAGAAAGYVFDKKLGGGT